MAFDRVFQEPPSDTAAPGTPQSPSFGVDVENQVLYISYGQGWVPISVASGSTFTTPPDPDLIAPNGGTTYDLGLAPVYPEASFYFVNGVKRTYGLYYTISGSTLTLLTDELPDSTDGDTHEIYYS